MLAATTSMNGTLGADNTDAVALFAQLMPTLAGNIATAIEFVFDSRSDPSGIEVCGDRFAFSLQGKAKGVLNKIICCAL